MCSTFLFLFTVLYTFSSLKCDLKSDHFACVSIQQCTIFSEVLKTRVPQTTLQLLRQSQCGWKKRIPLVWCHKRHLESDCRTSDFQKGICIPYIQCENGTQNRQPRSYKQCDRSTEFGIYVCCAIGTNNSSKPKLAPDLPKPENGECGYSSAAVRIVGGATTEIDEFPWMALIQYSSTKGVQQGCSGSLINKKYVITAAHCADPMLIAANGYKKLHSVVLGEYDTRNATDCVDGYCIDRPITIPIEMAVIHPKFRWKNDIALLRLSRSVRYTEFIRPICLPKSSTVVSEKDILVISGWGKTSTERRSSVKMKAPVTLKACRIQNDAGQICAGGKGTDSCNGDSGGPLMCEKLINGQPTLFLCGIISFGVARCGVLPSIYTNVSYYVNWITETISK